MKIFVIPFLLLLNIQYSAACTCANLTASEILEQSDSVTLAVTKFDSTTITREMSDEDDWVGQIGILTEFEVVSDYKRTDLKSLNVISPLDEGENCGIDFEKDDIVVLSTIRHPTTFEMVTTACSASKLNNSEAYELMLELEKLSRK